MEGEYSDKAVLIRRTSSGDGEIIRNLRISALTDAPYAFGAKLEDVLVEPIEKFTSDALRHSESEISTSFLAFDQQIAVGMIGAFFEQPSQRAFICSLWVKPILRGSSLAHQLVEVAMVWLAYRGAAECCAWVADSNTRAVAFYKKLGFFNTGEHQALPSNVNELEHLYRYSIPVANYCNQN